MEFSRQKDWSGLPVPSPGDLPDPGIELRYPALQADSLPSEPRGKPVGLPEKLLGRVRDRVLGWVHALKESAAVCVCVRARACESLSRIRL